MIIYKYPLVITDTQTVHLPYNAKILTAQMQGEDLRLWALVDELENLSQPVKIAIYGTGNPIEGDAGTYISTVQLQGGGLIFHVFEKAVSDLL